MVDDWRIRRCGDDWRYCNGNCRDCDRNKGSSGTTTEKKRKGDGK